MFSSIFILRIFCLPKYPLIHRQSHFSFKITSINPRTYNWAGGGEHPPFKFFWVFFLDDKASTPGVFSSCSFIPRAHFETALVIVSYYGYEISNVINSRWSSHFWMKMHVFSTSFNSKSKACGRNDAKCLFICYFTCQAQKVTVNRGFNLISKSW